MTVDTFESGAGWRGWGGLSTWDTTPCMLRAASGVVALQGCIARLGGGTEPSILIRVHEQRKSFSPTEPRVWGLGFRV